MCAQFCIYFQWSNVKKTPKNCVLIAPIHCDMYCSFKTKVLPQWQRWIICKMDYKWFEKGKSRKCIIQEISLQFEGPILWLIDSAARQKAQRLGFYHRLWLKHNEPSLDWTPSALASFNPSLNSNKVLGRDFQDTEPLEAS